MAKHIYLAHAADGTEFKRTSASRGEGAAYTHTVVYKADFNRDLDEAGKISETDASNFHYHTRNIAQGGHYASKPGYLTQEAYEATQAEDVARATEQLAGDTTVTAYQFRKRDERIARVLAHRDVWHNAGWCGRLDLAQKLAQATAKYGNLEITILKAVKVK